MSDPWKILAQPAIARWLDTDPSQFDVERVLDWIDRCVAHGPPEEGIETFRGDDLYLATVPRTSVVLTYVVAAYERLIILREIG